MGLHGSARRSSRDRRVTGQSTREARVRGNLPGLPEVPAVVGRNQPHAWCEAEPDPTRDRGWNFDPCQVEPVGLPPGSPPGARECGGTRRPRARAADPAAARTPSALCLHLDRRLQLADQPGAEHGRNETGRCRSSPSRAHRRLRGLAGRHRGHPRRSDASRHSPIDHRPGAARQLNWSSRIPVISRPVSARMASNSCLRCSRSGCIGYDENRLNCFGPRGAAVVEHRASSDGGRDGALVGYRRGRNRLRGAALRSTTRTKRSRRANPSFLAGPSSFAASSERRSTAIDSS